MGGKSSDQEASTNRAENAPPMPGPQSFGRESVCRVGGSPQPGSHPGFGDSCRDFLAADVGGALVHAHLAAQHLEGEILLSADEWPNHSFEYGDLFGAVESIDVKRESGRLCAHQQGSMLIGSQGASFLIIPVAPKITTFIIGFDSRSLR